LRFVVHQNSEVMKKQTGIWLDSKAAHFIELVDGEMVGFRKFDSGRQLGSAKGGAHRGGRQGGTVAGVSEKTLANRHRNEEREYFEEVLEKMGDADEVIIFGPGEAKTHLSSFIKEHPHSFKPGLRAVLTTDRMTKNEKAAFVKRFFEDN
jgi:hypothetical protein